MDCVRQFDIIITQDPTVKVGLPDCMLFRSSFRKDFAQAAGATFVALFSIIVTTVLVRTLGLAAAGKTESSEVFTLILLGALQYLPPAIVITVFISVMGVVSRAFKEQEMTAWFASGVSLSAMVRPVLRFSLPLTLLALICSVWLSPWARSEMNAASDRFANRSDVSKVSAGQFRESAGGNRVFFVERYSQATQQVKNVFVVEDKPEERIVLSAASGSVEKGPDGQKFLVLNNGRRANLDETGQHFTSTEFQTYGLAIKTNLGTTPSLLMQNRRVDTLLADPSSEAKGELIWRFSLPLSGLFLGLLAIPLAFVNPRGGQSLNQIFGLLIYLTYSNVVSITQSMVTKQTLDFWVALIVPHALVFGLFLVLLARRNRPAGTPWFSQLRKRILMGSARSAKGGLTDE